jgi:hypothetical protein
MSTIEDADPRRVHFAVHGDATRLASAALERADGSAVNAATPKLR